MTDPKCVRVEIPFQSSLDSGIVIKITQHIPIPPTSILYNSSFAIPHDKRVDDDDKKILREKISTFQKSQGKPGIDKKAWTALAMKRNPEILNLWERGRGKTEKGSFCRQEFKNGYLVTSYC